MELFMELGTKLTPKIPVLPSQHVGARSMLANVEILGGTISKRSRKLVTLRGSPLDHKRLLCEHRFSTMASDTPSVNCVTISSANFHSFHSPVWSLFH